MSEEVISPLLVSATANPVVPPETDLFAAFSTGPRSRRNGARVAPAPTTRQGVTQTTPPTENGVVGGAVSGTQTETPPAQDVTPTMTGDGGAGPVPEETGMPGDPPTPIGLALGLVLFVFCVSVLALIYVYHTFPNLEPYEKKHIKLPLSVEECKHLGEVLDKYKAKYYVNVLSGFVIVYVFLQTFAIPGSIFLSIMAGFLFPFPLALFLVCTCSATGASCCYLLSWLVGRRIIYTYFPKRVDAWAASVNSQRDNLLNYIIFLRVTPFLPNWFINIASPVIGVPWFPFFLGTFIGVAAPSCLAIQTGTTLHNMTAADAALSWWSVFMLLVLGFASLLPILFRDSIRRLFRFL